MATVRFSEELVGRICSNGRALFADRKTALEGIDDPTLGDRIYEAMMGTHAAALDALIPDMVEEIKRIGVSRVVNYTENYNSDIKFELLLIFDLTRPRRVPSNRSITSAGREKLYKELGITYSSLGTGSDMDAIGIDASDPRWGGIPDQLYQHAQARIAVNKECEAFVDGVRKLAATYTTLGPALKAWPPLWDLLPSETKERHKLVVERKTNAPREIEGVDLNRMSATVVFNKMTK